MLTPEQKQKVASLLAQEHVAVLITQGEQWPTGTMQAFAETDAADLIFIMGDTAEKYQNLMKRPSATVLVDTRDVGKIPTFEVARASIQGVARDVARDSAEFENLKAIFLKKNPFEAPFFGNPALRMMRIAPKRISYANGLSDSFKAEF
ncbi:MAG TPA: pyridoxamine 5'-phosphate oxidase family protein [Candidatus Binataceae bacterium]|nr:pyridoxamine 5'-phosphate oxidase family protein [Candidatus Binataceae bacterium]